VVGFAAIYKSPLWNDANEWLKTKPVEKEQRQEMPLKPPSKMDTVKLDSTIPDSAKMK
jgi:hypothetical protein